MIVARKPEEVPREQRPAWQLRLWAPTVIRFVIAVCAAAVTTFWIGRSLPAQLDVQTDIVGYPIHSNYNIELVISVYYLIVVVFPFLSLLLYLGLGQASQRIGLPASLRAGPVLAVEPSVEGPNGGRRTALAGAARALAVGLVFGVEVAVARNATMASFWFTVAFVAVTYAGLVIDMAFVLHMTVIPHRKPMTLAAALNALAAPLSLTGLLAVAAVTTVTVTADQSVHRYPWLPTWLALVATVPVLLWVAARVSWAPDEAILRVERRVVLLVAVPVCLFVLTSVMPGALGPINMYENGQDLVGARLTLRGYVPWRDVLPDHGLLQDQLSSIPGFLLFGDSFWGATAGRALLLTPLSLVFLYLFAAVMFEGNWAAIAASAAILLGSGLLAAHPDQATNIPLLTPVIDARFMFWPLVLVLMKVALDQPRWPPTALLGVVLVAWVVLVPESAYGLAAVGIVFVLRDLYIRKRGQPLLVTFSRTLQLTVGGAALALAVAVYLLIEGAFRDFFRFYVNNVPGHELMGGLPVHPRTWLTDPYFAFAAISPVAAVLLTFWYIAAAWLRRRLGTLDWVMVAAGILTLLYYTKFLGRADLHVLQSYAVAVPFIGLLVFQLCKTADGGLARLRPGAWFARRVTLAPIALLLLVATLLGTGRGLLDLLPLVATQVRAEAPQEPTLSRVGYSTATPDLATYADVDAVLRTYLGPGDWVFDFSNDPAFYYYLLGREPRTKYFNVSLAISESAQQDLISELKRDRPKLVVFSSDRYGLSEWDGIPNMVRHYDVSQYILDNYRPLLSIRGQILYADAAAGLSPLFAQRLNLGEAPVTDDLPFRGSACAWGSAPNFLTASPPSRERGLAPAAIATQTSDSGIAVVSGWAVDSTPGGALSEVVIMSGDRVVGRGAISVVRPDVAMARHDPAAARSGFQVVVSGVMPSRLKAPSRFRVFGISSSGVASELSYGPGVASQLAGAGGPVARLGLSNGNGALVRPGAVEGFVDDITESYVLQISLPPHAEWSDYRWLEIDSPDGGIRPDVWTVSDRLVSSPQRQVTFETLRRSPMNVKVYVGSCSQWHGYANTPLYVLHERPQAITGIRLLL